MKRPNKSILYLLPLIKSWSPSADMPNDCYAISSYLDGIVCKYNKDCEAIHPNGIIIKEDNEFKYIVYFVNDMFNEDYQLLMSGRYSKISDVCKQIILSRSPTEVDYEFLEGILYKSKKYKRFMEKSLHIDDIDKLTSEYESVFNEKEVFS